MEAGPRDLLKVKSKLNRAGKIHMGDGRETCDLNQPVSMSAVMFLYTQLEALGLDQGRVLKKRVNQSIRVCRKLFPTSLCCQNVSRLTHTTTLWLCVGSPKAPHPPSFQCAVCPLPQRPSPLSSGW